jgi:hypothetical protein
VTPEQLADLKAMVIRTRAEQGLPPTVEDPVALDKIATIMGLDRSAVGRQQLSCLPDEP